MLALVCELRGGEYAQVRGDSELLDGLLRGCDRKYWGRITTALGLNIKPEDRIAGGGELDLLGATTTVGDTEVKRYGIDEARELGVNEAELAPSHWGMLLTSALKDSRSLRAPDVNSIVTRAWSAGRRRERLTEDGRLSLSGTLTVEYMTAPDFLMAAHASISEGGKAVLERHKLDRLRVAYDALTAGVRPSIDDMFVDVDFRSRLKHTSGVHASVDRVSRLFEDLDDEELLREWSNIEVFTVLKARAEAREQGDERSALTNERQMRDFVLDVSEHRRKQLAARMPTSALVKVLSKLRKRLVKAMKNDRGMLKEEGFDNDGYSRARTKNLALLDEQRLRSTGAQYNRFLGTTEVKVLGKTLIGSSSTSAQTKESTSILLGHTRHAQSDLETGEMTREEVIEKHVGNIEKAQDELERRGEDFEHMRKGYNSLAEILVKVLVGALFAAGSVALSVLVPGIGGLLGVGCSARSWAYVRS